MWMWGWKHGTLCFLTVSWSSCTLSFSSMCLWLISGYQYRAFYNFVCALERGLHFLWLLLFLLRLVFLITDTLRNVLSLLLVFVQFVDGNDLFYILEHLLLVFDLVLLLLCDLLLISQHLFSFASLVILFSSVSDSLVQLCREQVHLSGVSKDVFVFLLHFAIFCGNDILNYI